MSEQVKVYVGHNDNAPIVSITTNQHKRLSSEALAELEAKVDKFIEDNPEDKKDWFPCGFVWIELDGRDELVKFIKKNGKQDGRYSELGKLQISKAYGKGYSLYYRHPATRTQAMNYNSKIYGELAKQLAFLYVVANVRSMVD